MYLNDSLVEQIGKWVKSKQGNILDFARELIEIPTFNTPPTGMEKNGQLLIQDILKECGWQVELYSLDNVSGLKEHPAYWPGRDYTERPNLLARFGASNSQQGQRFLFNGHMDVVPVGYTPSEEGEWKFPTRLTTRYQDGFLFGPGSADMKGGLVSIVAAAQCVSDIGIEPKSQLLIESVVDEEYGGANGSLAGRLWSPAADLAIIAEPTQMEICPSALCGVNYLVHFELKYGDILGTVPGVDQNPAFWLGEFIQNLRRYDSWRSIHRPVPELYANKPRPGLSISWVNAGFPPTAGLDRVPESCSLSFGVEDYPYVTQDQLRNELQEQVVQPLLQACPTLQIEIGLGTRFLEGVVGETTQTSARFVQDIVRQVTGRQAPISGMPASCDIFTFNHYSDTPALVLGPDGAGFHTPSERVDFRSILELAQVFAALMLSWRSSEA
jgi:acetylornithine deacetylase